MYVFFGNVKRGDDYHGLPIMPYLEILEEDESAEIELESVIVRNGAYEFFPVDEAEGTMSYPVDEVECWGEEEFVDEGSSIASFKVHYTVDYND